MRWHRGRHIRRRLLLLRIDQIARWSRGGRRNCGHGRRRHWRVGRRRWGRQRRQLVFVARQQIANASLVAIIELIMSINQVGKAKWEWKWKEAILVFFFSVSVNFTSRAMLHIYIYICMNECVYRKNICTYILISFGVHLSEVLLKFSMEWLNALCCSCCACCWRLLSLS